MPRKYKKRKPRELICKTCDQPFEHSGPGSPKHCLAHRSAKNKARSLRALARQDGPAAAAEAAKLMGGGQAPAAVGFRPMIMAVGLGLTENPLEAAEAVGLTGTPADLCELAERAKREHRPIIDCDRAAVGGVFYRAAVLAALHGMAGASTVSPGQAGQMARSMIQTLEMLTGGTQPAFSSVTLEIAPVIIKPAKKEDPDG